MKIFMFEGIIFCVLGATVPIRFFRLVFSRQGKRKKSCTLAVCCEKESLIRKILKKGAEREAQSERSRMFTQEFMEEMEAPFQEQLRRMGEKGARVAEAVTRANAEGRGNEAEGLKCLYASMPLSDALDYPVELFEAYARHGAFLWERGPFAGKVPERVFAGYVLHHRVNNEDLTDHSEFFYGGTEG